MTKLGFRDRCSHDRSLGPARVAAGETARLRTAARADPTARRTAGQLLRRLPGALARRHPVPVDVACELTALAARERAVGYATMPD